MIVLRLNTVNSIVIVFTKWISTNCSDEHECRAIDQIEDQPIEWKSQAKRPHGLKRPAGTLTMPAFNPFL